MSNQRNIENGNILYLIILYLSENISSISSKKQKIKNKKPKKKWMKQMYNRNILISYDFKFIRIKKNNKGRNTWKYIEHSILKAFLQRFIIRHFSRRNLSPAW